MCGSGTLILCKNKIQKKFSRLFLVQVDDVDPGLVTEEVPEIFAAGGQHYLRQRGFVSCYAVPGIGACVP